jgi:hypothetical protein
MRRGLLLTLERQVLTKVDLHCLLRAFRAAFGIVNDSLFADSKANHRRILRPVLNVSGDAVLLRQDLLEDIVGCTCAHCYGRTATLDASPCDKITDSEVMGVVWVGWKEVQAASSLG